MHILVIDLISLVGAFLLVGYCAGLKLRARAATVAAAAGALSYGVYLWHGDLLLWIAGQVGNPWLSVGLAGALTLMLAVACYVLVERPAMRFARRVPPRSVAVLLARPVRALRPVTRNNSATTDLSWPP